MMATLIAAGVPADALNMTYLWALGAALVLLIFLRMARAGKERHEHDAAVTLARLIVDEMDRRAHPPAPEPSRAETHGRARVPGGARLWGFGGRREPQYDPRRRHAR